MNHLQYSRDLMSKFIGIQNLLSNNTNFYIDDKQFQLIAKITDRFTAMRFKELIQDFNLQGQVIQKTFSTEEHIKEKKIVKKQINVKITLSSLKTDQQKMFLFLFQIKEMIKKKIYKKFSPFFYVSVPSIKIHYIPNNKNIPMKYNYLNLLNIFINYAKIY